MSEVTDERLEQLRESWTSALERGAKYRIDGDYQRENLAIITELTTLRRQLREAATALDHSAEYWDTLLIHGTSGAANELRKAYKARAQILRALKESV